MILYGLVQLSFKSVSIEMYKLKIFPPHKTLKYVILIMVTSLNFVVAFICFCFGCLILWKKIILIYLFTMSHTGNLPKSDHSSYTKKEFER